MNKDTHIKSAVTDMSDVVACLSDCLNYVCEDAEDPETSINLSRDSELMDNEIPCMLCSYVEADFEIKENKNAYLCHLLMEHNLVIADVHMIANLRSYAIYWKERFSQGPLEEFCSKIRTNCGAKDVGKSEEFYLLCDALPEDRKLREELQLSTLKQLMLRQEFERKDNTFERMCLFCSKVFRGNRMLLFNHLTMDHNFNVGHPDNIVNVREFLDAIEYKLNNLQCLLCENTFKDRASLREHMRKKGHRKLNPKNKTYDKYYIINHLEFGKNWEKLHEEGEKFDRSLDDWSGWEEEDQQGVCFFCDAVFSHPEGIYQHMKEYHDFDFHAIRTSMKMSFYQQIKMINFIRREVRELYAMGFSMRAVVSTMKENIINSTKWNKPQFYFPAVENDTVLCQLEDKEGLFEPEDNFVIGEDGIDCKAIISGSILTDLVVRGYFDV